VRRHDTPVVGRDDELAVLRTAWDTVLAERHAQLVTVIGDAFSGGPVIGEIARRNDRIR